MMSWNIIIHTETTACIIIIQITTNKANVRPSFPSSYSRVFSSSFMPLACISYQADKEYTLQLRFKLIYGVNIMCFDKWTEHQMRWKQNRNGKNKKMLYSTHSPIHIYIYSLKKINRRLKGQKIVIKTSDRREKKEEGVRFICA